MNTTQNAANQEVVIRAANGWLMLPLMVGLLLANIGLLIWSARNAAQHKDGPSVALVIVSSLGLPVWIILLTGLYTLQPNEGRVLLLFGKYRGTVRESGLHWGNPFYSNGSQSAGAAGGARASALAKPGTAGAAPRRTQGRNKISLRARTLNGDRLKVNDKRGNPIEIAAVVVWRVEDTAQAMFDVDNYQNYITTQSESSLRHLASLYSYDDGEENEFTLRSNVDEVSNALRAELEERLAKAGVRVDEARLMHLAYAPEIAQVMLRRQQAEAVIAARQKIVHGAVSMVEMALRELSEKKVVELDDERKAAMVSNLLVVLCGESEAQPVINTGTLYS